MKLTKLAMLASTVAVSFLAASANAATISKTDSTPGYFDASTGIRSFSFSGGDLLGNPTLTKVTIDIDFEKFDGESLGINAGGTPFYNEITFNLTSPAGTAVDLIVPNAFGSGSGGFRGVITFDDSALNVVNVNPNSPQAGTFRPIGSLASFIGQSGVGNWTLGIADTTGADHLGYYSATLNLSNSTTTASVVPLPSSVLGGAALLGVTAVRRLRRR